MIPYEMFEATIIDELVRYKHNTDWDNGIIKDGNELVVPKATVFVKREEGGILFPKYTIIRSNTNRANQVCSYTNNVAYMERFLTKYQIQYSLIEYSDEQAIRESRGGHSNLYENWILHVSDERLDEILRQSQAENQIAILNAAESFREKARKNSGFIREIQGWSVYSDKDENECSFQVSSDAIKSLGFRRIRYFAELRFRDVDLRDLHSLEEMAGVGLAAYDILSQLKDKWVFDEPYVSVVRRNENDCAEIKFTIRKRQGREEW